MTAQVYSFSANSAILTVACPAGRAALSGGARIPAAGGNIAIRQLYPVTGATNGTTAGTDPTDGQVADGYTAVFSAPDANNRVWVICGP